MLLGTEGGHPLGLPVSSATSLEESSASVQACGEWCFIWHKNMKDLDKTLVFQATGKKKITQGFADDFGCLIELLWDDVLHE